MAHNIIKLNEAEDMVTDMACNEVFDLDRPDVFSELVWVYNAIC